MSFYLGLDLGQSADYSALAALERQGPRSPDVVYHCRHLERWPLRTPYPEIAADVARMVRSPELRRYSPPVLAVDATGVGAPVVDLLRAALGNPSDYQEEVYEMDDLRGTFKCVWSAPPPVVTLRAVQITGGDKVTTEGDLCRVPKRDLVSAAQVALQTGRVKVAPSLAHAATLARELQTFQVKISLDTAHDSYGAWREGAHDDLVLAVCLALWAAANVNTEFEEEGHSEGWVEYG